MTHALTSYLNFFRAGLMNQGQTGGIVPSQRFLIGRMIAPVPATYRGRIIELGSGGGSLTRRLAARCPAARILACEINPALAQDCRSALANDGHAARVEVVTSPAEILLSGICRSRMEKPDFIISGIPLGNLGGDRARSLIDSIWRTLAEGGLFIQFQHSLLDRKNIKARFPDTRIVPVLLNFPPAFIYYARKAISC
jgi:phospholipid N-methyltransferase